LPWHRVISSNGKLSMNSIEDKQHQKKLLEIEGIEFSGEFKIDLKKYLWDIDSIENIKTF